MTPSVPVPQANPGAGYVARKAEIDAALAAVLASGWYILGREVQTFEREFAAFVGVGHAVGVASGTDALILALWAMEIGPGDAVATVAHTAVATVAAIELTGATPVLVDIEDDGYTLDPQRLEDLAKGAAGLRLRAVIPVHLYGQPAAVDAIAEVARRHGLAMLEDCAQAHGAAFANRRVGAWGRIAAFSFYPTKNLGALGDGGMIVTDDADLAERARALRQYGWRERYVSEIKGMNSRLDEVQAAVLRVKLRHLDADNRRRQEIAAAYDAGLAGTPLRLPARRPDASHVFHQYVVRTVRRDALQRRLKDAGVGTNVHYPVPVHLHPAYRGRIAIGPDGLAASERAAAEVLSLPMFPELTDAQVARVCDSVRAAAGDL